MTHKEAFLKYTPKQVPMSIMMGYTDADMTFVINDNDPDLAPITVYLPKPPDWKHIKGFGKPAEDQVFERQAMPPRLNNLRDEVIDTLKEDKSITRGSGGIPEVKIIDEIWERLEKNQLKYKDEISWIKEQWYYLTYGYWFFCNGKPTYINKWHYRYLHYWTLEDIAHPEYRDKDRRWFIFIEDTETCTTTPEGRDFIDRLFFGVVNPKHRRDGATSRSLVIGYDIVTKTPGGHAGIQSFDETNAKEHYISKVLPSFQDMPFFLKPIWRGSNAPQSELEFKNPGNRIGRSLGSVFDYAKSAGRKAYEGQKLHFGLLDEEGKTTQENIVERWSVLMPTFSQGARNKIFGLAIHPSTVYEMTSKGGANYKTLCEQSRDEKRDDSGRTTSGLRLMFMPAYDGLEGFIDKYGGSVIKTPTPEQSAFIGKTIGAEEYLSRTGRALLDSKGPGAADAYRDFMLENPTRYKHCFYSLSGDSGLNIQKIDNAISRIETAISVGNSPTVPGRFMWIIDGYGEPVDSERFVEDGLHWKNPDGRVEFFPCEPGDEYNSRWNISEFLIPSMSNRKIRIDGLWYPENPGVRVVGADPITFLDERAARSSNFNTRLSKGGGAAFRARDKSVDTDNTNTSDWETYKFIGDYSYRPISDDVYAEDILMGCIYWGAELFQEYNIKLLWKYLIQRGYSGFLKYQINDVTGRPKDKPGLFSLVDSKQDLMNALKNYIEWHSERENHLEILSQARQINGIEEFRKYDVLISAALCLEAIKIDTKMSIETENKLSDMVDLGSFMRTRKY
jgi:hypothetical protein